MKLLLDESLPRQLASRFPDAFEVMTVQQMGWAGTKNGALLSLAAENGFAVLITADKGIEFQHNPAHLQVAIVVLSSYRTRLQDLEPLIPELLKVLDREPEARVYHVGA